ncbi:PREDICTED: RNA polymerase II-associated protein 3 [Dufourea novaeangliae]|uniref:RNA polymerase II-associated protein 3 n=1 Tax=Dufourea novaeangliae TaxID=178035 RepID=A0A154P3P9_DUFNO|nr:PREDICTED: RNA polymerase II-associated protein 3 [Dufourea novaeangliae]KZC06477.1 RNA polymerase II-associated protein 3 [Dufourea novaeangliae]
MDKSLLMQKQVKDNAEDMQKEFLDMKNWEEQMKQKDEELKRETSGQTTLPPIRSRKVNKTKNTPIKKNGNNSKSKRIKSYDYSAWDKFDVDKACKDMEKDQFEESEGETMSKEELEKAHDEATKHKNEGNTLVQQQKWAKAVGCYTEAIKLFPYDAVFYANRALCQLKLDNLYAAESDCSAAIQLDETYVKAYHRRATARMNLKQYKEAKQDIEKILKLEPSNKDAKSLLVQIENKIKTLDSISTLRESTEKSSEKLTIETKIGKKLCSSIVPSIKTTDVKDTENKNNKVLEQTKCNVKDTKTNENLKHVKNGKTLDVGGAALKQKEERYLRIPDWLPEKNDVVIIEPVAKPPHLRSKKSLKRIPVEEADFGNNQWNVKNKESTCDKNKPVQLEETRKDDNIKKNSSVKASSSSEDDNNIVQLVPKTAVQFVMNWKTNTSSEFRYKYLKQLPENSLPKIFKDSMESDIFSDILEVLRIEFVKRREFVFRYLKDLSEVKRFRALIMFISNKEKECLKALFEHCRTVEGIPLEEITALQHKFEI